MGSGTGTRGALAEGGSPGVGPPEKDGRKGHGWPEVAPTPGLLKRVPRWHAALRLNEIGVIVAAVLVFGTFSIVAPAFLTPDSWGGILASASEYGLVATGITLLLVAGEFDLTVGVVFAITPLIAGILVNLGWDPWVAFGMGEPRLSLSAWSTGCSLTS